LQQTDFILNITDKTVC